MNLKVLLANIDRLIRVQKTTDNAVSIKAGDLKGTWTLDVLDDVAKALDTSAWELLRPPGAVPQEDDLHDYIDAVIEEKLSKSAALPARKRKNR